MNEPIRQDDSQGLRENGEAAGKPKERILLADELWGLYGEEFRNLRTKVTRAFEGEKHRSILVTSALPREGKTTVSVNLARSLAQASWRTLLVDGDMRAPDIHRIFGLEREPGLSDILKAAKFIERAVKPTDGLPLDVLPAGSPSDTPAELINATFAKFLFKEFSTRYDYVILDSPPALAISDTLLLSRHADGVLMVVEKFATPRETVKNALEQFQGAHIIGLVLNGVSHRNGYYGYYRY